MFAIKKVAEYVAIYFQEKGIIEKGQEEIYSYGLEEIFIEMFNILSIFLIGLLFGKVIETLIFVIVFRILRSYTGGYHAKTPWRCYVLTMLTVIIALSIIRYPIVVSRNVSIVLWVLSGIAIFLWAPVEAENKPLDQLEIKIYGKKAKIIWCLETICFLVSLISGWIPMYESVLLASVFSGLSLLAAKMKKYIKLKGE